MRGLFCFETSDRFDVEECIRENLDAINDRGSGRHAGMFGMHASLSLSDETLRRVAGVVGGHPVYVHVAESPQEEAESLARYGKRSLQRYQDHRLLNKNSLLAHCTNIDESEAEIAARQGCTVAINVNSNMNAANGLPDYALLKKCNVRTIIGNDSFGVDLARDYLATIYCMHLKMNSVWKFGNDDLLACIRNVYDYTGTMLGIRIGRLEPGYAADMITVPYHVVTVLDRDNAFDYIVSGVFQNVFHPREVWCGGDLKMKNYETVWDEDEVYARAREAAARFWQRIGGI
jgi:cytosine/adenosine deaminase-related metal-dependent hydrolase